MAPLLREAQTPTPETPQVPQTPMPAAPMYQGRSRGPSSEYWAPGGLGAQRRAAQASAEATFANFAPNYGETAGHRMAYIERKKQEAESLAPGLAYQPQMRQVALDQGRANIGLTEAQGQGIRDTGMGNLLSGEGNLLSGEGANFAGQGALATGRGNEAAAGVRPTDVSHYRTQAENAIKERDAINQKYNQAIAELKALKDARANAPATPTKSPLAGVDPSILDADPITKQPRTTLQQVVAAQQGAGSFSANAMNGGNVPAIGAAPVAGGQQGAPGGGNGGAITSAATQPSDSRIPPGFTMQPDGSYVSPQGSEYVIDEAAGVLRKKRPG